MQRLSFCDWFILLSIRSSRFIHVPHVSAFPSLLRLVNIPFYGVHHVSFTRLSVCGHLNCFYFLAIVTTFLFSSRLSLVWKCIFHVFSFLVLLFLLSFFAAHLILISMFHVKTFPQVSEETWAVHETLEGWLTLCVPMEEGLIVGIYRIIHQGLGFFFLFFPQKPCHYLYILSLGPFMFSRENPLSSCVRAMYPVSAS